MQRAQILKLINEELRIPGRQRSKHSWLLDHGAVDQVTTKLIGLGERNIDWTPLYVCVEPDPSAEPLKRHADFEQASEALSSERKGGERRRGKARQKQAMNAASAMHTHFTYKAWSPAGQKHSVHGYRHTCLFRPSYNQI